jgi:hypothetical protein
MFDVCDDSFDDMRCSIVIYVESHYLYMCMPVLEAPQLGGRQNRQTFFKKNLMFLCELWNIRLMFLGELRGT